MKDRKAFGEAMLALGVNARVEVTDAQRELFWRFLGDLTDEQFQKAVALWIRNQRWFPQVAELLELARPHVDHAADAVRAFEDVIKNGTYTPHGYRWSFARIAELIGPIAAEAYAAAGASKAFEHEQGERDLPFLRKRFTESYVAAAEAHAKGRELARPPVALPPATPLQQLVEDTAKALEAGR